MKRWRLKAQSNKYSSFVPELTNKKPVLRVYLQYHRMGTLTKKHHVFRNFSSTAACQ